MTCTLMYYVNGTVYPVREIDGMESAIFEVSDRQDRNRLTLADNLTMESGATIISREMEASSFVDSTVSLL